ncbi:MAG: hypothetical protein Q4D26_03210 [Clostridia bacterium]|nr:hypothetical protein [Clostridia bacterium]
MNLGFKRIMSSVLAFVMTAGTLVIANVAGVSAASTDILWNFTNTAVVSSATTEDMAFTGVSNSGTVTGDALNASILSGIKITKSTKDFSSVAGSNYGSLDNRLQLQGAPGTWAADKYNIIPAVRAFKFTTTDTATVDVYLSVTAGRTLKIVEENAVSADDVMTAKTTGSPQLASFNALPAGTYYIYSGGSGMDIWAVDVTYNSASYTWSLNTDSLTNVDKTKVSIDTTATGTTNTLSYSGTDYVVKTPGLAEGVTGVTKDGNDFTVTVTDDMFLPVTEGITVSVANAGGKTLKLVGANNGYTYNLTLDENGSATGIALVQDTYTLSIAGGTLGFTSVVVDSAATVIETAFTSAETVSFVSKLNAGDLDNNSGVTEETLVNDNLFKLLPTVKVDSNKRNVTLADGTAAFQSTKRINTSGKGSTESNAVVFKTAEGDTAGKVYVYALSGNSSEDRSLVLTDGTNAQGSGAKNIAKNVDSSTEASEVIFDVQPDTEYTLYCEEGGASIYYIGSTISLQTLTIEATTETTTEAPGGDYVAMGTYTLNSSTMGGTSKTGTYENMEYSLSEVNSSHVRIKSTNSITFKVAESASMTAVFSNHGLVLKSGGVTVATLTSGEAVHLDPNVEYTLSGDTTSNTYLTALTFEASGVSRGTISGTVSYVDNAGTHTVSGIQVHYENSDGTVEGIVVTDTNGKYTTPGLDEGTYTLTVYATDLYNEASATAEVTNGSSATANITVTEKDTSQYDITFNVTNNSGSGNTVIIKSADTGDIVDESSVTWTDGETSASVTLSLQTGSYAIELLDKTAGKIGSATTFTVSSAGSVDITVNAPDSVDLSPLEEGKTYTFGSGNISATDSNFYILGDITVNSSYIALTSANNASVTFYVSGTQTIVITASNKSSTLTSADGTKSYTVKNGTTTLELTEGYYSINGGSGTGIRLKTIEVLVNDTTEYSVSLSGTNNTNDAVTVSVKNAAGNTVAEFSAAAGEFNTNVTLTPGTYTLSTPSGSSVTDVDEFTVSADATSFSGIVIDTDTSIDVPVTVVGNTSKVSVTINGTSYSFAADSGSGNTITLDNLSEGATVTFKFADSVANKITGWEGLEPGTAYVQSSKSFTAAATSSGFKFTYASDAMTSSNSYGTSSEALNYGNYGFGATKGTAVGATQAENVNELNIVGGTVTLYDYMSGYRIGDERLILNNNQATGVSFTAIGDGYVIIDTSYGPPAVTVNGTSAALEAVGTSTGKKGFSVKAGDKVEIHSGSTSSSRSVQLKSVRFQTDGNVFKLAVFETFNYSDLTDDTKALVSEPTAGNVLVRIIGTLNTADVDSSTVDGVGVLVMTQADVASDLSNSSMFVPTNYVNSDKAVATLYETDTLYDGVYDGITAADSKGNYTHDSAAGSAYDDGVYYMLRHIGVAPGSYYVFPYSVVGGNAVFDVNPVTDTASISSYLYTVQ